MKYAKLFFYLLICITLTSCANSLQNISVEYPLGDDYVGVRKIESKRDAHANRTVYINLHENESTSVKAAKKFIRKNGGVIYMLHQNKKRNVVFNQGGQKYQFDPNRIFTDEGIRKTMVRFGNFSKDAHRTVSGLSDYLIQNIRKSNPAYIIALHNNTEANYSLESYEPGGIYEKDALAVHKNPAMDADDFYFTTSNDLYDQLKARDENSVMQNNAKGTDDGSLSIFAGRHEMNYVNIEAQHKHKQEQYRMINLLHDVLYDEKK